MDVDEREIDPVIESVETLQAVECVHDAGRVVVG
jgi:hypothetical protein